MMHTDGAVSASIGPLAGGLFASFANLADDGTLCFVSDKLHRACPACGTVFTGSAWRAATTGSEPCPFCGWAGTRPMVGRFEA